MLKRLCLIGLMISSLLFSDDFSEKEENVLLPPKPIIKCMRGLVLVGNQEELLDSEELQEIEGIYVKGVSIPGNYRKFQDQLNDLYFHQELNLLKLKEIETFLYRYFEENHSPFILVVVPPQKISQGVFQVVIVKSRLGRVKAEGNRWFGSRQLTRYVTAEPGHEIDVLNLQKNLDVINRNPFRRVNAVYTPGKVTGTTDIILATEDRLPARIYSGVDNTGVISTGRQRIFGGMSLGKIWNFDQLLSYQYTTSYDFHHFQAHTGQWMVPLLWNHLLNFYGGYTTIHARLPYPEQTNVGKTSQISGRYTIPLRAYPQVTQEFSVGFDYKNTNNTLLFSGLIENIGHYVNLSQFMCEYKRSQEYKFCRFDFEVQGFYSPGQLLSFESPEAYAKLRPGATADYVYGRALFRYVQRMPHGFSSTLWLRGQLSSADLLPSEQFGIGGYDTVRGYDERQLNMDNGVLATLEFRTPPLPFISFIRKHPVRDSFQFLAFADYGWGRNHTLYEGEPLQSYLLSIGPGLRYTLDPYISIRFDYGFKLHHQAIFTGVEGLGHFNITASY